MGSTVTTGQLHVHLGDGTAEGHIAVLLVHVDGIGTGQVTENNAVVLDATGLLLENLAGGDSLTLDLSDLVLALHVVPELGASEDSITMEHTHAVERWVRVLLGWQSTTDDIKLSQLHRKSRHALGPAKPKFEVTHTSDESPTVALTFF